MRRLSAFLGAIVLTVGLSGQAVAAAPTSLYVAVGDSLAVGDGASDMATTAYVPLMADYFAGHFHGDAKNMVNLAIGGETTGSFAVAHAGPVSQMNAALAAILDPTTDTKVVTLSIGGNDLLDLLNEPTDPCVINPVSPTCQAMVAAALGGVATNLPVILGTLDWALAQDPGDEVVYVLTLYNPFGGTGSPYEAPIDGALLGADMAVDCTALGNPYNVGLDDIVACTSMAFGAVVIDGYAAIGDNALALTHIGDPGFNIHPNDDGYAVIAKAHRVAQRAL
jgi:lysophospholipase L1-like esterase